MISEKFKFEILNLTNFILYVKMHIVFFVKLYSFILKFQFNFSVDLKFSITDDLAEVSQSSVPLSFGTL